MTQTQKFFLKERNDCQNQLDSQNDFRSRVKDCIEEKYRRRIAVLKEVKDDSDHFSLFTRDLDFVDLHFLKIHGMKLLGRTLRVPGTLVLDIAGPNSQTRLRGSLKDKGSVLPVVFKSMPASQAEFLDQKKPFAHHEATLDQENAKLILRVSSILGQALGESSWDPVGKYGESYACAPEAKEKFGDYSLEIKEILEAEIDKKYSVLVSLSNCPSGHLCSFEGVGKIKNGTLVALARNPREEDPDLQKDCQLLITKGKNNGLKVGQLKQGACEKYFLCGAYTRIDIGPVKKR